MTDHQHPITPPLELIGKWEEDWHHSKVKHIELEDHIATAAAHWGADQELEACCEWTTVWISAPEASQLRAARRPKPPSLKEQALSALEHLALGPNPAAFLADMETIRRALEALPND